MRLPRKFRFHLIAFCLLICATSRGYSYSVLAHEAIIDAVWDTNLKSLLLARFPEATPDQLLEAHAYAYGGSIIQDMGYYPFGSKMFTDLLHYVRSGDFIIYMVREAKDLDEYAFALGALSHYAADTTGHSLATNVSVPLLYPKLQQEFGNRVTYAEDHTSHIRTEFSFDVLQVAQGHYAPESYHHFIGFQVSRPLLERAFQDTYGLQMKDVFKTEGLAIGSYRKAVSSTLPLMTRVAWKMKGADIRKDTPTITKRKFLYNLSRASYEKEWGKDYEKPGFGSTVLAFIFRIVPKIGPFKAFRFKTPTPEVERDFMVSFDKTLTRYKELLAEVKNQHLTLPNVNFDVGDPTAPGKYTLCDHAYAELLDKLHGRYADIPSDLRRNIIAFYGDLSAPIATKANATEWAKITRELEEVKAAAPVAQSPVRSLF